MEEDSPDHTLQRCEAWEEERELLRCSTGQDLSLSTIISKILESAENWEAFLTFSERVMLAKEDERARERLRENSVDTN